MPDGPKRHRHRRHRRHRPPLPLCRNPLAHVCRAWEHFVRTHQHRLTLDGCKQWPTTGGDLRHLLAAVGRRPQLRELRFEMEAGEESYLLVVLLPQLRNLRELLSRDAFWRGL